MRSRDTSVRRMCRSEDQTHVTGLLDDGSRGISSTYTAALQYDNYPVLLCRGTPRSAAHMPQLSSLPVPSTPTA